MRVKVRILRPIVAITVLLLATGATAAETVRVMRVLRGDQILLVDGRRVKYIGVGIPSSPLAGRSVAELRRMSLDFNRSRVNRETVKLVFDKNLRSREGDWLAYVYLDNQFINAEMIEKGCAVVETDPDNTRYTEYFKKLLRKARQEKVGFWEAREQAPEAPPRLGNPVGKIVYTQPGDPYYYPKDHPKLGAKARPILIEDARHKGLKPFPLQKK